VISLAIIAKNEQDKIERCIRSVPFAVDCVVVDSGSTDETVKRARALGARVFQEEWRGYQKQKQRATDLCQTDWVLSLDADEALSPELAAEIQELAQTVLPRAEGQAFRMRRRSFHLGRWIRYGGWTPDWQTRLFDRRSARWEGGAELHENIRAQKTSDLATWIEHWPFDDLSEQVDTNNRYSTLGARQILARGQTATSLHLILRPIGKFIECYFLKRGFLDGVPGLIIAVGAAYSLFLRYAKAWEAQIREP
jgi:glycosyltransferase involved in cell wall biosynthesis